MKKYTFEIGYDEHAYSPREWDNVTTMLCFHKRHTNLGDKHNIKAGDYNGWDEMEQAIREQYEVLDIAPLYCFEHGAIQLSTAPFSCPWDSGRIGFIIIEKRNYEVCIGKVEEATQDKFDSAIKGELQDYNKYLNGEIYEFKIFETEPCNLGCEHKTLLDSIGGYYSEEDAIDEAKNYIKMYEKNNVEA